MKRIFIVDPGMMEAGGHHAALLSTLISYHDVDARNITLVTHNKIANSLSTQAEKNGVAVLKYFDTNFYENYENEFSLRSKKSQQYIYKLAQEYIHFFSSIINAQEDYSSVTFFYPCLNWDHAYSLNLALRFSQKQGLLDFEQKHKICCMFKPIENKNVLKALPYKQAFSALQERQGVQLFATDLETQQFYEKLAISIKGIHPCYLLPWVQLKRARKIRSTTPRILLYLGDAKENKGFNSLPTLIEDLLIQYDYNVVILVQYTLAWEYPELTKTINLLDTLSKKYKQLKLYKEYWDTDQLVKKLYSVDIIYCTYSIDEYREKSSGLAWLASFFQIPVVLGGACWLSREFKRLGHNYRFFDNVQWPRVNICRSPYATEYSDSLFTNFLDWLEL